MQEKKRLLPSEKIEKKKAEAIEMAKLVEKREHAFNTVFSTAEGRELLKWLHDECGFARASISFLERGTLNNGATIYNEARRNIYLQLRDYLTPEILREVENKLKQ